MISETLTVAEAGTETGATTEAKVESATSDDEVFVKAVEELTSTTTTTTTTAATTVASEKKGW